MKKNLIRYRVSIFFFILLSTLLWAWQKEPSAALVTLNIVIAIALWYTNRQALLQGTFEAHIESHKKLFEHSPQPMLLLTEKILYVNRSALALFEAKDQSEIIGLKATDLVDLPYRKEALKKIHDLLSGERNASLELVIKTLKGTLTEVEAMGAMVNFEGKIVIQAFLQVIDEKKATERQLEASERMHRAMLEALPDIYFLITRKGTYKAVHAPNKDDLIADQSHLIGASIVETLPPELCDKIFYHIEIAFTTREIQTFEYGLTFSEHDTRYFEARMVAFSENEFLTLVRNITEHKKNIEEINTSLRQKETLLQEVHHRVKNNLQIINSLMSLQLRNAKDIETKNIFRESQNRIKSMALIHERFYRLKEADQVDFSDYLKNLAQNLIISHNMQNLVTLSFSFEPVSLSLDRAVPSGLIVNEIITNSLKHGFSRSSHRQNHLQVDLFKKGEDITILLKDNGSGLPEDFDTNKQGLGWQLIHALTAQARADISVQNNNGVEVIFTLYDR